MRYNIFYFLFFIFISLSFVCSTSLSGSPSSLEFNLIPGEEQCLNLNIYSEDYSGDLYSVMRWAEKDIKVNHPRDFKLNSSEIDLDINYNSKEISNFDGEETIEVCILGNNLGNYKGSLEYRTNTSSNVGVGVGTWIKVNITEKKMEEPEDTPTTETASNSGSSGGRSSKVEIKENMTNESYENNYTVGNISIDSIKNEISYEETEYSKSGELEEKKWNSLITGGVVGVLGEDKSIIIFTIIVVALGCIGLFIYNKRQKKIKDVSQDEIKKVIGFE